MRQKSDIAHEKSWTWLQKGNLKWDTEALLIAAQNNAIKTSYVERKLIIRNRITSVGYGEKEMKWLIT